MSKKIGNKELRSVFWRSFALQGAFNYERMQNVGYCYAMIPVIKKLYDSEKEQAAALTRHLELFNTTPAMVPTIMGITAAMEEQNANNEDFDPKTISAVKTSLMGPFAGIGDSLFWGTFRVIAAGIGVSFATQGSVVGPLLFLLLYNIPSFITRIGGLRLGYKIGVNSLERLQKEGLMDRVMSVATIIGMFVVGGMVASMVNISTPVVFTLSGTEMVLQNILDDIFPKMLPLACTFGIYKLLKKGVSVTWLMLIIIAFGIVMHLIGVL